MENLFGTILGAGMDPALGDLYKKSKKRLDQGMVPAIQKADGSVGPGKQSAPAPRQSLWERITRGV